MAQEQRNSVRILQSKPQKKTPKASKASVIGCLATIIVCSVTVTYFWYQPATNPTTSSMESGENKISQNSIITHAEEDVDYKNSLKEQEFNKLFKHQKNNTAASTESTPNSTAPFDIFYQKEANKIPNKQEKQTTETKKTQNQQKNPATETENTKKDQVTETKTPTNKLEKKAIETKNVKKSEVEKKTTPLQLSKKVESKDSLALLLDQLNKEEEYKDSITSLLTQLNKEREHKSSITSLIPVIFAKNKEN